MASARVMPDRDPADRTHIVYEDTRTRVARVAVAERTVIRKEPIGLDAGDRLRREVAVLQRLRGAVGVVQLAPDPPLWPGSVLLADAGPVSLADLTKPMPADEVVGLGLGLARAVVEMHRRGVIHRNICPANVVVSDDGTPSLVGFSLAATVTEPLPELTAHREIVGSLPHLAPEQTGRTGRTVDERADLYALGATLYELAVGTPPFGSGDPLRLLHDHLTRMPESPSGVDPTVPEPLSRIVMHLLEKEPDHRYQTAEGVLHDLQRLRNGEIDPCEVNFRVGAADVAPRSMTPSRIIGRTAELAELEAAFAEVRSTGCRGVVVVGPPGVGKTALVDQMRPVVTSHDGWFVAGKFDQYRRDLEFDAGYQVMRALGRLLLAEPEDELALVRHRIKQALGSNAGLVTAVLPEFAALLGTPPNPGDPLTAQARAQLAGLQILRAVASRKRPLFIFYDDLQWAGRTPLGFVDLVLSGELVEGLLLVVAYRDSDVDIGHPLTAMTQRWRSQAGLRLLRLRELAEPQLTKLVAETMNLTPGAAAGLVRLIGPYTRGNPYETVELLNALRQNGRLTATAGGWRWDDAALRDYLEATESTGLFAERVAALPAPSRQMVEAMAALGGRAELSLLATATDTSVAEVRRCLTPVLGAGLLVAEERDEATVRFRHDRIREAVIARLDPPRRSGLHLAMARRLATVPQWFAIAAEQYLPVVDSVTSADERRQVVALLWRATDQAALIGEYALVSTLLGAAAQLIDPAETDAMIALRTARHAALYSAGRLDEADDEYRELAKLPLTPVQRGNTTAVQLRSLTHRNRYAEVIALGVRTLTQLGIAVPVDPSSADLDRQFEYLYRWLAHTDDTDELARPEVTDPTQLATTRLLSAILPATTFALDPTMGAWLGLQAARIWIDHGPAPTLIGPMGSAAIAAVALRGDYIQGERVLRRVLTLGEARGYEPGTSQARYVLAILSYWVRPIEECVHEGRQAREGLIAGGDLANAAYTFHPVVRSLLECAEKLDTVAAEVTAGLAFTTRTGNEPSSQGLRCYQWLITVLRGESSPQAQAPSMLAYAGNRLAALHACVSRAIAAAIFGNEADLAQHTEAAKPLLEATRAFQPSAMARMLRGLAVAIQARTSQDEQREPLLAELDEAIGWLAARAADAPANFAHLVRLLEAERAWALGDFRAAELAFDTALREVMQRRRPWHRALITEHAARFYLAHGVNYIGHLLLTRARAHYAAWGAAAKVDQLDWAFPTLLPSAGEDGQAESADQPRNGATSPKVTGATIDLLGILSASQALSSETTLERLHARVASVLAAMTGATNVHLLLWSADQHAWLTPTAAGASPTDSDGAARTPMSVLRYLERTREPLVVTDATTDDRFGRDPYFADTSGCALLAVPILIRGALRAVLLLENRLIRGAFTSDRLDPVALIAGQLAVSLDNAKLYADLTASRKRIVATADSTRRRMERDLHDGAQQRLVALTLQLRTAQASVPAEFDDIRVQLEHAAANAEAAMNELREVAQGLHPAILTAGGLGPALRTLARRVPIPLDLEVRVDGRLPEPVEVAAYYIVAEALTNIAKHAQATTAAVSVRADAAVLHLTIRDNGIGGADLNRGTGLLGLTDRAEALGGQLSLDSAPGAGTALHARLPISTDATPTVER